MPPKQHKTQKKNNQKKKRLVNTATCTMSDSKKNAITNAATNNSVSSKIESCSDIKQIMESFSKLEKLPEELVTVKNTLIHIEQFMESVNKENYE